MKDSRIDGISYSFKVAIRQQMLLLWKPGNTLSGAIISIGLIGLFFIGFALLLNSFARSLFEVKIRYDDVCSRLKDCSVEITLDNDVTAPIFFYYYLPTFFQNHRQMIEKKSYTQLSGLDIASVNLTSCDPVLLNSNLSTKQSIGNNFLNPSDVAYPCGGYARAFFNGNICLILDTFSMTYLETNSRITLTSKGIAYPPDLQRYANMAGTLKLTRQWVDVTDERFAVWMRTSPSSAVKKLWARIDANVLKKGRYNISIQNNWYNERFNTEKWIIINQVNAFGGKNIPLANSFAMAGSACIFACLLLGVRKFIRKRGILRAHLNLLKRAKLNEF
jgi:hypothetical protein